MPRPIATWPNCFIAWGRYELRSGQARVLPRGRARPGARSRVNHAHGERWYPGRSCNRPAQGQSTRPFWIDQCKPNEKPSGKHGSSKRPNYGPRCSPPEWPKPMISPAVAPPRKYVQQPTWLVGPFRTLIHRTEPRLYRVHDLTTEWIVGPYYGYRGRYFHLRSANPAEDRLAYLLGQSTLAPLNRRYQALMRNGQLHLRRGPAPGPEVAIDSVSSIRRALEVLC